jgi:hypothetical protein
MIDPGYAGVLAGASRAPRDEEGTGPKPSIFIGKTIRQRDSEVFFWPSGFLEAWGTKAKQPQIFRKRVVLLALPPRSARPKNHSILEDECFFGLGTYCLQKDTWPKKHFRGHLTNLPGGGWENPGRKIFWKQCYPMLRNNACGPEIGLSGRISAGFSSGKHQNRPSGRPSAGRGADF